MNQPDDHWKNQPHQPSQQPNTMTIHTDATELAKLETQQQPPNHNSAGQLKLLPTKAYRQVDKNTGTTVYKPFPDAPVRWTAQPVLEWMESLVAATEEGEAASGRSHAAPICIDGVSMSAPTPPPPVQYQRQLQQEQQALARQVQATSGPQQHTPVPKQWDFSYIYVRDQFAWKYIRQLAALAVQYESLPHHDDKGYRTMQSRLEFTFDRILGQHSYETVGEYGETRFLLDMLYQETIQKMQALLNGDKIVPDSTKSGSGNVPVHLPHSGKSVAVAGPIKKQDLAKYMTAWLRNNWTNPYPDEEGLAEMARDCGSTPTVVSNWLINARTRKWRPAIVKAIDMHRPSDLLLEDSINIFDGKPVRELHHHPNQDDDDEYDAMSV